MRSHNLEVNPDLMAAFDDPDNDPVPIHVIAIDSAQQVVGGLIGETQFAWLKIGILAVSKSHRRRGIGRELLQRAEDEARQRGCRHVFLDSMEYHSPDFYKACGYTDVCTIEDWDSRGHTKYFFTKNIEVGANAQGKDS